MAYKRPERKGSYDRRIKRYVWRIVNPKFHRKTQTLNGVRGTLLPYVFDKPFLRPGETSPRGNPAYLECWRQTWWANGRVCFVKNKCIAEATDTTPPVFRREFEPVTASVFNRWDTDEPAYTLVNGLPVMKDENGNLY